MKKLYSVLVMLVCAIVGIVSFMNLYAYLDLGMKPGIAGVIYAVLLLLAAGLFLRTLMVLLKS